MQRACGVLMSFEMSEAAWIRSGWPCSCRGLAVGVFACFSFLVLYKEALEGYLLLSGMLLLVFLSYPNTDFCVLNSQWTLFPYYS